MDIVNKREDTRFKKQTNSFYCFPGDIIDTVFTDCYSVDDPSLSLLTEWACGARWVQAQLGPPTGGH